MRLLLFAFLSFPHFVAPSFGLDVGGQRVPEFREVVNLIPAAVLVPEAGLRKRVSDGSRMVDMPEALVKILEEVAPAR